MATVQHLLEHTVEPGSEVIDDITTCVVVVDDSVDTTTAAVKARGVTILNAAGYDLPTGYFDVDRVITTYFANVGDVAVFGPPYKDYEKAGGSVTVKKGGVD